MWREINDKENVFGVMFSFCYEILNIRGPSETASNSSCDWWKIFEWQISTNQRLRVSPAERKCYCRGVRYTLLVKQIEDKTTYYVVEFVRSEFFRSKNKLAPFE